MGTPLQDVFLQSISSSLFILPQPTMSSSPLATSELLSHLETISTEIPTIISYLAQSLNTLRDIDPARREVWVRNLAGLGGQYYGRIDVSLSSLFPFSVQAACSADVVYREYKSHFVVSYEHSVNAIHHPTQSVHHSPTPHSRNHSLQQYHRPPSIQKIHLTQRRITQWK